MQEVARLVLGALSRRFPQSFTDRLGADLRITGSRVRPEAWITGSLSIFFLSLSVFIIGPLLPVFFWLGLAGMLCSGVHLSYPSWRARSIAQQVRDRLPSVLLSSAASVQTGQTPEEAFVSLSERAEPPLDSLFKQAVYRCMRDRSELGACLQEALSVYRVPELDRAAALIASGIRSGSGLDRVFNTVARDLVSVRELSRQQVESMSSLRFALLLSGVVLIPAVLALSVHVSSLLAGPASGLGLASEISFVPFSMVLAVVIAYFCDHAPGNVVGYAPAVLLAQFLVYHGVLWMYPKI